MTVRELKRWVDRRGDVAFELIRIYLGIGLFVRGVLFIGNQAAFAEIGMEPVSTYPMLYGAVAYYVALSHLAGGVLVGIGLLTRWAALAQIPVLAGAVFLVHMEEGLFTSNPNQSLEFSALVLFLLILIFVFGAGPWSVDHYLFDRKEEREEVADSTSEPFRRTSDV